MLTVGREETMVQLNVIILASAAVLDAAWGVALWRHQPERVYQKKRDSRYAWYWLDLFGIPRTERNCVRFLRGCYIAGMVLVTLGSLLVVVLPHP